MPSVKYNPLKKTSKSLNSKIININPENKVKHLSNTIKLILVAIVFVTIFLGVRHLINRNSNVNITGVMNHINRPMKNNDSFDISKVPSGNMIEGFNNPIVSSSVNDNTEIVSFESLTKEQQQAKCVALSKDILAFRNKLSGATFRFQKVDKFSSVEDYLLLGESNNGRVVEAQKDTSLTYAIKDSANKSQIFTKINTGSGNDVFFVSKEYPDYALQYEHDHLSLRTHNGTPYEGQKFFELDENDKALKDSISFGIGKPHLSQDDLYSQGPRTFVFVGNDGSINTETDVGQIVNQSQSALDNLTQEQLKEVVGNVLRDYNQYKTTEQQRTSSMFGNKPLQFNINLGDGSNSSKAEVEGFRNLLNGPSNLEQFDNLRNGTNNSADIRSLLNRYSQQLSSIPQQYSNFGNNNLTSVSQSNVNKMATNVDEYVNKLQETASGTAFKGCPRIDKSKYVTGRQVSRCYGCNPDSSLQ